MVKNIHEINKNDVLKIGETSYTVVDRLDQYKSSMDTQNNLQKIEVFLADKDVPERNAIILNTKEGFFLLHRIDLKKGLLKKLRFRFAGELYELKERYEVVRSEKDVQFFNNARVYKSRNGIILAEKLNNKITVYKGEMILKDDIFVVEKSAGTFLPKRHYFNNKDVEKKKVSPLLAAVLSFFFLFFGLLYLSPWFAMLGFVLIMIPPIIFGPEAFLAAPFICLLLSQITADLINRKHYRF